MTGSPRPAPEGRENDGTFLRGALRRGFLTVTHVCLPQLHLTWYLTRRLYNRLPTWRTGLCSCCNVPWRRTASQPLLSTPTPPQATGAFSASPPRFTTMASLTSAPRMAAMHGSGMTATGRPWLHWSVSYPAWCSLCAQIRDLECQSHLMKASNPERRQKSNLCLWKPFSTPSSLAAPPIAESLPLGSGAFGLRRHANLRARALQGGPSVSSFHMHA